MRDSGTETISETRRTVEPRRVARGLGTGSCWHGIAERISLRQNPRKYMRATGGVPQVWFSNLVWGW
jgi:hypothetical protein